MRKHKWVRRVVVFVVVLLAASAAFSRLLRSEDARGYLIAHLVASFGRPVDVERFDFSLLDGARIEAQSVTVAEDPHFGNEYFLRAETLTAGLRWRALLSGRFEFGSLSLLRPSLNLVRDAEGHWNIERWLPPAQAAASRPGFVGPLAPVRGVQAARLYRIDIDGGRINFKQRDDKSPFALLDVAGRVEQDTAGRWQLDIETRPMRAGVMLQDIGMLRLRGTIAGTSARLQPAELNLTWRAASLADALRLVHEQDYGMRGTFNMDLTARVAAPESGPETRPESGVAQWSISGAVRVTGIHGWKLVGRDTDPAANLSLETTWRAGEQRAGIQRLLVEMSQSRLQAAGDLEWGHGIQPQLHIQSSSVSLADALSWYRALRPGVAEDLQANGVMSLDITIGGWPLQLEQGALTSQGGTFLASSLPGPLQIGPFKASVSHGGIDIAATTLSMPTTLSERSDPPAPPRDASPKSFVVRGSLFPETNGSFHWPLNWNFAIQGGTPRVQDWLAFSDALSEPLNDGWSADGSVTVSLRGAHKIQPPATQWLGTIDFRDVNVAAAYINQPVRLPVVQIAYTPVQRTITVEDVEALGASWHGTIARKNVDKQWTFDLSADDLDAADLDRWLGPRARPGLLERLTAFGSSTPIPGPTGAFFDRLAARGRLRVGEIRMASVHFDQFDGAVELTGRSIAVRKAHADFFGGDVSGSLDARLYADPSYVFDGHFDRVDLSQLARAVPFLNDRIGGIASATVSLSAHGIGRQNLIGSMDGNGMLSAHNAELPTLDLTAIIPGENDDPEPGPFSSVQGNFAIHETGIDLTDFVLDQDRGRLRADGRINFSHALNIRLRPSTLQPATSPASLSPPSFILSGTIEEPKLGLPAPAAASRFATRGR